MEKIDKVINYFRCLREEASASPTMSVGTGETSLGYKTNETPPVNLKKKKRYIYPKNRPGYRTLWKMR